MDITARRQMERQLHKEQEFARRLVNSFPDLILVVDSTAHFTFVSPRCSEVLATNSPNPQICSSARALMSKIFPPACVIHGHSRGTSGFRLSRST